MKSLKVGEATKITMNLKVPTTNGEYTCKFRFEFDNEGQT